MPWSPDGSTITTLRNFVTTTISQGCSPSLPTPIPVRARRLFLQFFTLVDAHCELTYLELRPLVFFERSTLPPYPFSHPSRRCSSNPFSSFAASTSTSPTTLPSGLPSTQRRLPSVPSSPPRLLHRQQRTFPVRSGDVPQTQISTTLQRHHRLLRTRSPLLEAAPHLFQHAAIPLQFTSDTLTTRSTEISFQQHFRPQLNHPWINPLLRRRGLHRPQYNIPTTRQGPIGITRLHRHHRRLERRHAQECLLDLHLLKTSDVLHLQSLSIHGDPLSTVVPALSLPY